MRFLTFLFLSAALLTQQSCTTDFDVNAPKEDITVVYGLLDQSESTHFIKINKAFIGPEDAALMAQVRDSSEYGTISAKIEQYKEGNLINTFTLKDTVINDKDTGFFYAPEQTLYYFVEPNLDQASSYRLVATIFAGEEDEKTVSAETELVNGDEVMVTFPPFGIPLSFASVSDFIDRDFVFNAAEDGKRYQLTLIFPYENELVGGGFTQDSVVIKFPTKTVAKADGLDQITIQIKGEDFFQAIAGSVKPIVEEPHVLKRRPIKMLLGNAIKPVLKYKIAVACEDLNTYIEVNSPTTGIVQQTPEFTNIDGGIGIFSCRYNTTGFRHLDNTSVIELVNGGIGGYTSELGFCDNTGSINAPNPCD